MAPEPSSTLSAPQEDFELRQFLKMNRIKRIFEPSPAYVPVDTDAEEEEDDQEDHLSQGNVDDDSTPFSRLEYSIFLLLGMAMLWAWNMFLAAAPFFQSRFEGNTWILNHFQAAEVSISAVTNLGGMTVLSSLQKNASYPFRIWTALVINAICFTFLAVSTLISSTAQIYFGFLLIVICLASLSTALIQNGLFAFASGFARPEYTQAIMTGQGVAGVLPPLAQIVSVLLIPPKHNDETGAESQSPKSAFIYFITATAVSVIALVAFLWLLRRQNQTQAIRSLKDNNNINSAPNEEPLTSSIYSSTEHTPISLYHLLRKLPFLTAGVFITFLGTMLGFPVFTASILSNTPATNNAIFIPLAFLVWNVGDLLGRLITISPRLSLTHYPFALFSMSMARLIFIPMYLLCNIKGRGATIPSDFFYLIVVQLLFGLSNGYIGSSCMMGASDWVLPEEREAAGGFMGLALVGGLTAGSLLSFTLGDV